MREDLGPIQSLEAEMSTLGSMILSGAAAEQLCSLLTPEDFYRPAHKEIYRALSHLVASSKPIDLVTLRNELLSREKLGAVGGEDYLIQIAEYVPSAANATHYAQIVLDKSLLRRLETAGRAIVGNVHEADELSAEGKLDQAEKIVFDVGRKRGSGKTQHVRELAKQFFIDVDQVIETGEAMSGIGSGFCDLDRMTTGFYGGDLVIVGARPSMGKTSLALDFALAAAREKKGAVAIFSLEMSGTQLVSRIISMISGVNSKTYRSASITSEVYRKLADACEHVYSLPLHIDDASDMTPIEMRGICRRLQAQEGGLALVVVDYLQLMKGAGKQENRTQEMGSIARGLKAMAKELNVPVIALSQLNRGVEARENKRPVLSDIRESGDIEAEADLVMLLYRDAYYKAKEEHSDYNDDDQVEEAEVIIAKHRNGATGKVILGFQPTYARYRLLERRRSA